MPLADAKRVVEHAEGKANRLGIAATVSVVNAEGTPVAIHRMDGATLVSVEVSREKAYTAAATEKPTADLTAASQPGGDVYGLASADRNRLAVFGGGVPLDRDGTVLGAVGVSGGSVDEDVAVATAGADAFVAGDSE
nr:heme-binding protein [Halomarina oriensis]